MFEWFSVHYVQQSVDKKIQQTHIVDLIWLKDIDDSNEWFMRRMEYEGIVEDDLVFVGDDFVSEVP